MSATVIQELAEHPELIYRHTVEEYHEMIAMGMIREGAPFELLDGQIVRKIRSTAGEGLTTVGIEHALVVKRLVKLDRRFEHLGCHVQSQQPITILPDDEPEPDAAIVSGSLEDYSVRHPGPTDILSVIEVADSSLGRDRGYKQRLYADAAIPMYVIVNLIDRVIEVYLEPVVESGFYTKVTLLSAGQKLDLPTVSSTPVTLLVTDLLN